MLSVRRAPGMGNAADRPGDFGAGHVSAATNFHHGRPAAAEASAASEPGSPTNGGAASPRKPKTGVVKLKRGLFILCTITITVLLAGTASAGKHRDIQGDYRAKVVSVLNHGLTGSPMAGTGLALEQAGWRWKVSPYFIAGIAATESTLGRAACSNNPKNGFGLSSCRRDWRVPYFRTWWHAYQFMGRFLTERWPHARTPWDYSGYAACSSCWGNSTARHMRELFGVGPETRYGATQAVA